MLKEKEAGERLMYLYKKKKKSLKKERKKGRCNVLVTIRLSVNEDLAMA